MKTQQPDQAQFVDLLFSKDELETKLNEGFRGHPSIGAVVMSSPDMKAEPWRTLWNDIESSQGAESVRVFLVGSIFGGTGAAGVPTFGATQMLKYAQSANIDEKQGKSKVLLGSTLMLPYFGFDVDPHAKEQEVGRMFVTPTDFPLATKAALTYYSEKNLAFDEMYLLGDSLNQKVGQFSPGSGTQQNRAHYIELASALAAFDFYAEAEKGAGRGRSHFTAARDTSRVDWRSLPITRDADRAFSLQNRLKERIASMTALSYALLSYGAEVVATGHGSLQDAWYKANFKFDPKKSDDAWKDPRHLENKQTLDVVSGYAGSFLDWICDMDDDSNDVSLVRRKALFEFDPETGRWKLLHHRTHPGAIGSFLDGDTAKQTFTHFYNDLNTVTFADPHAKGADKLLGILYEAAQKFCRRNYRISIDVEH